MEEGIDYMVEKGDWIPYNEIVWNCPYNNKFNIDTRDFHAGYNKSKPHKDLDKILSYGDRFLLTKEELTSFLDKIYVESGGNKEDWRFLNLKGMSNGSWNMKYIRIWRIDDKFIVCDSDGKAFKKSIVKNTEVIKRR